MGFLKIAFENHRLPKPAMRSRLITQWSAPEVQRPQPFRVAEHTVATDTISCILAQGEDKSVLALNFANAMVPGGGYLLGGNAQEEALCRASLLFYTISKVPLYYIRNQLHILPTYTDGMILSEDVPVIRDNDGTMLTQKRLCSFITCPAVNRSFARFLMPRRHIQAVMQRRIERIIQLAAVEQPDVLILGAFGCGVFGNRREDVYPMFEAAIDRYLPQTVEVLFAVPDMR